MKYLLDTNAVIYLLKGVGNFEFMKEENELILSFITIIELLAFAKEEDKENIQGFLMFCEKIFADELLMKTVIKIRKNLKLKIPDAKISATSIEKEAILVTADKEMINKCRKIGIVVLNPLE